MKSAKMVQAAKIICKKLTPTVLLILCVPLLASAVEPVVGDAAHGAVKGAVIGGIAGDAGAGAAAGAIGSTLIGGMRRNR